MPQTSRVQTFPQNPPSDITHVDSKCYIQNCETESFNDQLHVFKYFSDFNAPGVILMHLTQ